MCYDVSIPWLLSEHVGVSSYIESEVSSCVKILVIYSIPTLFSFHSRMKGYDMGDCIICWRMEHGPCTSRNKLWSDI